MQGTNLNNLERGKILSNDAYSLINKEIQKYPPDQKKSAVIASLIIAQRERGFISPEIEEEIGNYLEMAPIAVHEIATFYNMFERKPKAKFKIVVCTNLPCALRNSKHAISILTNRLGIGIGETTKDNLFSLHEGECFGACADAPVMLINNHKMYSWMRSFLRVVLDSEDIDTSELMVKNVGPVDPLVSVEKFNKMVRKCKKRFIAISVQLIVKGKPGTHANMLIIDTKKKIVELFEPHGKRSFSTTMDSLVGAYNISDKLIKKYFKKYFPEYKYISPQVNLPSFGLQAKVDAFNGMCVTYCIMYLHYRVLNPSYSQKYIIKKMKKQVTKDLLLKYAKYIEEMIK